MKATSALSLALAAGIASTAAANTNAPTKVDPTAGQIKHVAHIYFNIGTGEKITTLISEDAQRPVDGEEGSEIWVATLGAQCTSFGDSTSYFWGVDTFDVTSGGSPISTTHEFHFDWGDIAPDTVVDCVQIHWITNHADVDLVDGNGDPNPDGNADGVVGLAGTWTYWDAMNGRAPQFNSIATPIVSLGFFSLPGELSDPGDSFVAFYTADIDLATTFGTSNSLVFEIGDTDGDLNGAAVHNSNIDDQDNEFVDTMSPPGDGQSDMDPDNDGLADWGWSLIYDQPGTVDVDNADGDDDETTGIDGDANAAATTGVVFASPTPGHPEHDTVADTWSWVSDGPTAGATEDVFNSAHIDINTGAIVMDGPFWFGGLRCTLDQNDPLDPGYRPAAHFQTVLYGPGGTPPCEDVADLNGDGELDFVDISQFAQTMPDLNGDTAFDFVDIGLFVTSFQNPCP